MIPKQSSTSCALPPVPAAPPHLTFIEGLRALAALWVVLSHVWISQFGMDAHVGTLGSLSNWLIYSHLAVDVFIVLSGFCLTLPLVRDGGLRGGARGFWKRRARRILPPCYLSLAFAVGVVVILHRLDRHVWQLDLRALAINLFLLQDLVLRDDIYNGPLWSIAVECRMYLVFPLLAWALRRGGMGAILLPAALVGYGLTALILWKFPLLLLACPWYLLLFAIGMCAASTSFARPDWKGTGWGRPAPLWLALVLAGAALVLLLRAFPVTPQNGVSFGRHMPIIDAAVGVLTAVLLVAFCRGGRGSDTRMSVLSAPLCWPPLVALGQFSYSLYLTHGPVLSVLAWLLHLSPNADAAPPLLKFSALIVLGLPLMLGFAYLFFLGCERPFLNRRSSAAVPPGNI